MPKKAKAKLGPPYPAPPIIECVAELRFTAPVQAKFVDHARRKLSKFYDNETADQLVEVEVRVDAGVVSPHIGPAKAVVRLSSADETSRCTVQTDKIYWTGLPPYPGWGAFLGRIERDVASLGRVGAALQVGRVGLRYRNRIDVPTIPGKDTFRHADYLQVGIDLPDFFDPTAGFNWQVRKDFPDRQLSAVMISGVMEPALPGTGAVLLDIDVFAHLDVSLGRADISSQLEKMRALKNLIFEHSIKDRARESFQ